MADVTNEIKDRFKDHGWESIGLGELVIIDKSYQSDFNNDKSCGEYYLIYVQYQNVPLSKREFSREVDICCRCFLHFSSEAILSVFDSRAIASSAIWKVCFSQNCHRQRRTQFSMMFTLMLP